MKPFEEKENKMCKKIFNITGITSIAMSCVFCIAWLLVALSISFEKYDAPFPMWYNTVYQIALYTNPCLLFAFIVSFITMLCLKMIGFKDYKKQFILFIVAGVIWLLSIYGSVIYIALTFGLVLENF